MPVVVRLFSQLTYDWLPLEGVLKAAKVCAIFHYSGEDVAGVALADHVENLNSFAMNLFSDPVFTEFNLVNALCSEDISPVDV